MTRERFIEITDGLRANVVVGDEEKKGIRFKDDDRVLRGARMLYYGQVDRMQLPTFDEFLGLIDENWVNRYVPQILKQLLELDHHYESKQSWFL